MTYAVNYPPTGDPAVDALLDGSKWSSGDLTYGFPATSASYGANYGDGEPNNGFTPFNAVQQAAVRTVLADYASFANLHFTELVGGPAGTALIRFAQTKLDTAEGYLPGNYEEGGDVWVNNTNADYANPVKAEYAFTTLLHEVGHALGLKHPHEADNGFGTASFTDDQVSYSVMSYKSFAGAGIDGYVNGSDSFPQTPMIDDIRSIQALYGANWSLAGQNVTYTWDPNTGEGFVNGVGQGAPGYDHVFQSIWDGGAHATYDLSNYSSDLVLNLQPGQWSTFSAGQLANLSQTVQAPGSVANAYYATNGAVDDLVANALGGSGNDEVFGNQDANSISGGGGTDTLFGGQGADTIVGGDGPDQLYGGKDDDQIVMGTGGGYAFGNLGNDHIDASQASGASLYGGQGDDLITAAGSPGSNWFSGDLGNDTLVGGGGHDTLSGGDGADSIVGGTGGSLIFGNAGNDVISVAGATSTVYAGQGDDRIVVLGGGAGHLLSGDAGNDVIVGGIGDDTLIGGAGGDTLSGGGGANRFVFTAAGDAAPSAPDHVLDFNPGTDRIDISALDVARGSATPFHFVGAYDGAGGEAVLVYDGGSNTTSLLLDVNGDRVSDFDVVLNGQVSAGGWLVG